MKLNKYSWLAALPLLFTACQDDMLVEKHSQQGIYTLSATVEDGSASSRAQIVLNGTSTTKESFHWNEEDAFTLFQLADEQNALSSHQFTISSTYTDEKPTASAEFSTMDALTAGREFVAFYPSFVLEEGQTAIPLNLDNVLLDNTDDSWKEYFKNNMFMMKQGIVADPTSIQFEQLCGIIRITYKNTSSVDRTFERIRVNGTWITGGYYHFKDLANFDKGYCVNGNLGVTFENKATVKAGATENFYILYLKNEALGEDEVNPMSFVGIDIDIETKQYMMTPSKKLPTFKTGKCYWLNITDDGKSLTWTNDQQGGDDSGDDNVTNKPIEVSTFSELKQALATQADPLIVVLKNNIEMETPLSISSPTNLQMLGYELSIADNYETREMNAVFEVYARLTVNNGSFKGKDGVNLHEYYFMLNGTHSSLNLRGVSLNTGTAITNAVFMDDDNFHLEDFMIWNETDQTETAIPSSITTLGNAIHYVANDDAPQFWSYINGDINGNVYVETEYETSLNAMMIFQNGTINGNLNTANVNSSIDISEYIRKADAVTIGSGYTGWDKAGRFVEDQRYQVSTFAQLKAAFETAQDADEVTYITLLNNITLESPLIATKPININGRGNYALTLSESFDWSSGVDAAIIVEGENPEEDHLYMNELIMKGSMTSAENKYLVKTKKSRLNLDNTSLVGNGVANAAYLEDADMNIHNATYINVDEGGYALYFCANTRYVQAHINITREIVGNVGFTANVIDDMYPNVVALRSGTINGEIYTNGSYKDDIIVDVREGAVVNGTTWNDLAIGQLLREFKSNGHAYTERLTLNNQEVIFSVGKVYDNSVNFHAQTLEGSGTVKFVNNTEEEVTLFVDVENLSDNVNFEFEGKFRKILDVHTTRVKEFFEVAENTDQINIYLSDDVVLNQQIVVNKNLLWTDGSVGNEEQGHLFLMLEGHTLTTSLDVPAIVIQGGFFTIDGGKKGSGVINASSEFVQIGAENDEANHMICVIINPLITVNSVSNTWMCVDATGTKHKNVEIYIHSDSLAEEERVAKVRVDESYTGNVTVCGIDKSNNIE